MAKTAKQGDRWTPVRRGPRRSIYCSPACGADCKWVDYMHAARRAGKLARQLGRGWKVRVWENFGWHYEVKRNYVSVKPSHYVLGPTSYGVWIEVPGIQVIMDGPNLRDVMNQAAHRAREVAADLTTAADIVLAAAARGEVGT